MSSLRQESQLIRLYWETLLTADIFPSYILEPKKIIESITWFLNPIEEPPQKFLKLLKDNISNIYSDILEKEGFIVRDFTWEDLLAYATMKDNNEEKFTSGFFNLVFSLANEELSNNIEMVLHSIHDLLRPSSYFIYEIRINQLNEIRDLFLKVFESVNFLIPWSELHTNPFSPFDSEKNSYCWVVALSHPSDDDPAEWLENL